MPDLETLARQKCEAALQRRLDALPKDIKALQANLAAKGQFQSGSMLKQVLAICQASLQNHAETAIAEHQWAVEKALFASHSWVLRLSDQAERSVRPLYDASVQSVTRAADQISSGNLAPLLVRELEQTLVTVNNDISLAMRAGFAEKSRGLLRNLPASILNAISRLFKGGTQ